MLVVEFEKGTVVLKQAPMPKRRPGEALIRLLAAGICNTDLELLRGYYNFQGRPGHEFVGEVVESSTPELVGQRVVGEINIGCGRCSLCRAGDPRHCSSRRVLGILNYPGVFAEYFTLPDRNLHVLPRTIPTDHGVFVEPLAAANEILEQVRIPKGAPVAVLGDGKLGLLIAQVLTAHGAEVHLFGRHPSKLALARRWKIRTRLSSQGPAKAAFQWVVEATGSPEGLGAALELVQPRGTIIAKTTLHGAVPLDISRVVVNEVTIVGSRCGRFPPAIRLLQRRRVDVAPLVTARMPLSQAQEAFQLAAEPGTLKVLLVPDGTI